MSGHHTYVVTVTWTGNTGEGTANYNAYARSHTVSVVNKAAILGSSDPAFRGDKSRYNPEELLVASLSSCHMLWYLHLCAESGVTVLDYADYATGTMLETADSGGHFTEVTLHPVVTVAHLAMVEKATALHKLAKDRCYIANSVNFPVLHKPVCKATAHPAGDQ